MDAIEAIEWLQRFRTQLHSQLPELSLAEITRVADLYTFDRLRQLYPTKPELAAGEYVRALGGEVAVIESYLGA